MLEVALLSISLTDCTSDEQFYVGNRLMSKEPLATIVTRSNDVEFSDVINWVANALFYGEEQWLTKEPDHCQMYTNFTSRASDLNFMNAVHCVGNCGEILDSAESDRGMNQINDGTTGMIYAIPVGALEFKASNHRGVDVMTGTTLFEKIKTVGSLNCGVVIPDGFEKEALNGEKLVGMSIDNCQTLAAALFHGNFERENLFAFSENNSPFVALINGTIDILAGAAVEKSHYFERSLPLRGVHFSTPYYYGTTGMKLRGMSLFVADIVYLHLVYLCMGLMELTTPF